MGREWLRAVAMAVAVLVAGPIRLSADESDQREMARLASGHESQIEAAVAALVARYDPLHYTLLQGLFTGEVYRWEEHLAQSGLVIIGEEEMDDYGDSIVPLFTVYPQREPILAASPPGAQMTSALVGGPSGLTMWFTTSGGLT